MNSGIDMLLKTQYITIAINLMQIKDIPSLQINTSLAIIPEDLFSMGSNPPGKTLVIGSTETAVEIVEILSQLNFEVDLLIRNSLLRGFDKDITTYIGNILEKKGAKIIYKRMPIEIRKNEITNRINVKLREIKGGHIIDEQYDTVIYANNMCPPLVDLNLRSIGLKDIAGKLKVNEYNQTIIPHIYAIGDSAADRPENSSDAAIFSARFLSQRLFKSITEAINYRSIPLEIKGPAENGYCGYNEQEAFKFFGKKNIEVLIGCFSSSIVELNEHLLLKVIVNKIDGKIIGFHYLGPKAYIITQYLAKEISSGIYLHMISTTISKIELIANIKFETIKEKKEEFKSTC